jgi:hypothetical protein
VAVFPTESVASTTAVYSWVTAWLVDTAGRFARRENDGILAFNEIS